MVRADVRSNLMKDILCVCVWGEGVGSGVFR